MFVELLDKLLNIFFTNINYKIIGAVRAIT